MEGISSEAGQSQQEEQTAETRNREALGRDEELPLQVQNTKPPGEYAIDNKDD